MENERKEIVEQKPITQVSVEDIKFKVDTTKSYDQQAEEVVNAIATAKAVANTEVAKELTDRKAEELKSKAETRAKTAEKENLNAETAKQEAERQLYEGVLQTFGITKHLPKWLMQIMVMILSPIYIILTLIIGVPFGFAKTVIDNADNVLVRYEKVDEQTKPRLKAIIWVILTLTVLAAILLTVLKILNKI